MIRLNLQLFGTDYLTTDTELTSIADAIRAKGGTSASLEYPTEFVSAIEAISTGTDVSDTTATAGDVVSGKYFYTSSGTKTQGSISTLVDTDITVSGRTITIPVGKYTGASGATAITKSIAYGTYISEVSSHTIDTTPVVTGDISGTVTSIGTTTQPSGTDGTDYWTITPSGSVTTTGVSSAMAQATVLEAGYLSQSSIETMAHTVNITPTVTDGTARYIEKGTITNNVTSGTSSGTINRGKNIKIGAGYYPTDLYYTAQDTSGNLQFTYISKSHTKLSVASYSTAEVISITAAKDHTFRLDTEADTALDTTSDVTVNNNAYRRVFLVNGENAVVNSSNQGQINVTSGGASKGTINVTAYNSSELESAQTVVSNGKWVTTNVTEDGTYYGKVVVPNVCVVLEVEATASTTTTINNSDITENCYVFNTASTLPDSNIAWTTGSGYVTLTCPSGIPAMTLFICRQL